MLGGLYDRGVYHPHPCGSQGSELDWLSSGTESARAYFIVESSVRSAMALSVICWLRAHTTFAF